MAVPSFIDSQTQDSSGATTITFDMSTITHTTDDLMIAFVKQSENTGQQTWDDDGGGSNGWTQATYNRTTGGRDQETSIYWKFATSASESDPTFDWDSGGTNEPMSGSLLVYRGVDQVAPFQGPAYASAQNDANPPNPSVEVIAANTRVICFHAATHDDIWSAAAPTGFTLRTQVWAGTANDHRNHFTADIERDTVETYSPPDWQHSVLNTTPEYHTYTMALNEARPIHVTGGTVLSLSPHDDWNVTNVTVVGDGFEAVQGTGKVEIWSDLSGTTKVSQSIDSWSDTSIQLDMTQGALGIDAVFYVVVTNDTGDVSAPASGGISVGLLPYHTTVVDILKPDHYWRLNNTYADTGYTGPPIPMIAVVVGTWSFDTQEIVDGNTHCVNFDNDQNKRECAQSPNMNITITSSERTWAFWLQLNEIQHALGSLFEEGGGVQNAAFFVGFGNVVLFSVADVPGNAINAQGWSSFKLATGRPYHICGRYSLTESPKEVRLFIDGEEQPGSTGNPLGTGSWDAHSGDISFNKAGGNLEIGGTDVAFQGMNDAHISDFASWSDNSAGTNAGALDKTTEIRDILFRRGALPDDIIVTATEASMQTALDATADVRPDWPLSYRIEPKTGGGDVELTLNEKVFDSLITLHLEWRGADTLTLINTGTSNIDSTKCFASNGGTITILDDATLALTNVPNGAEVRIFDASTQTELGGSESVVSGTFALAVNESVTTSVDVRVHALGYVTDEFYAIDLSSGDVGLPLSPRIDRVYKNL
ncbi:MAG: hypothetical protein HN683_04665 [Gammaproteobacteria bacterium]|nr:hypothetical protein [Gammaproteobacteria bacterium]